MIAVVRVQLIVGRWRHSEALIEIGAHAEILPQRFRAIRDLALPKEHRDFLHRLTFDAYGRPLWDGHVAGIDAVYELKKRT